MDTSQLTYRGRHAEYNNAKPTIPGMRVSFKHIAGSMVFCAFMVAFLNIYMNIVASYSMPSLQLDMSPDGDVVGFHQFDLAEDHHHQRHREGKGDATPQYLLPKNTNEQGKSKKKVRGNRLLGQPGVMPAGLSADQVGRIRQDIVDTQQHVQDYEMGIEPIQLASIGRPNNAPNKVTPMHCPGLCPPDGSPQTQENYVRGIIVQRMRNLPPNTFTAGQQQPMFDWSQEDEKASEWTEHHYTQLWKQTSLWTNSRQITPTNITVTGLRPILSAIRNAKLHHVGVPKKGTQLKLAIKLTGDQYALWKPKRFKSYRNVPTDTPYAGADRHYAEIGAFYVGITLGLNRVPIAMGRSIDLDTEVVPVAEPELNKTMFFDDHKQSWCFYGKCMYCKKELSVCTDTNTGKVDGAMILWNTFSSLLRMRSPWARTYEPKRTANWETDINYCNTVRAHGHFGHAPIYLDLMEMAIFDFIIGNADRHRLELFMGVPNPTVLLLDNGKAFGGQPNKDELTILAPIYQCCQVRRTFYDRLLRLSELNYAQLLNKWLRVDPLYPILEDVQLQAVNRRLRKALVLIAECVERHGDPYVLVNDNF